MNNQDQLLLFDEGFSSPFLNDELSLIALGNLQGVGFATVKALFNAFNGHLSSVWGSDKDRLLSVLHSARTPQPDHIVKMLQAPSKAHIKHAQEQLQFLKIRQKVSILFKETDDYPPNLYSLNDPPAWLFVEGSPQLLHKTAVAAVIGTRQPTEQGLEVARQTSVLISNSGYIILSGLADGIDAVAHQTAIDYGMPTIAVLGHGINIIYPVVTSALRQQIVERGGCVVSEYLPSDMYSRERFVNRNRIQAALSDVVCVIEGQSKSGTAHTVRFARQMGREVIGAKIGDLSASILEHTLLIDIAKTKGSIFDVKSNEGRMALQDYLMRKTSENLRMPTPGRARLFRGILPEIYRLIHDYNVTRDDLSWLSEQIQEEFSSKGR